MVERRVASAPRIVVVTGPTASGKSALALALARELGGEIVSADSMQVYRHLDIGTAKPSAAERREVPHHLVDVAEPEESYHAARFRQEAARAIEEIAGRGRLPLVVGGTGLYIKVLLQGLAPGPGRCDAVRGELEARWDAGEGAALWAELRRVDPELARALHPRDRTRILRGLEVWRVAGEPLSAIHRRHRFRERPYAALLLGVERPRRELCERIDRRVVEMLEAGWVEEVERVLARGVPPGAPALQAIGYRTLCAYLERGGSGGSWWRRSSATPAGTPSAS